MHSTYAVLRHRAIRAPDRKVGFLGLWTQDVDDDDGFHASTQVAGDQNVDGLVAVGELDHEARRLSIDVRERSVGMVHGAVESHNRLLSNLLSLDQRLLLDAGRETNIEEEMSIIATITDCIPDLTTDGLTHQETKDIVKQHCRRAESEALAVRDIVIAAKGELILDLIWLVFHCSALEERSLPECLDEEGPKILVRGDHREQFAILDMTKVNERNDIDCVPGLTQLHARENGVDQKHVRGSCLFNVSGFLDRDGLPNLKGLDDLGKSREAATCSPRQTQGTKVSNSFRLDDGLRLMIGFRVLVGDARITIATGAEHMEFCHHSSLHV
jgi:hypothetical protein